MDDDPVIAVGNHGYLKLDGAEDDDGDDDEHAQSKLLILMGRDLSSRARERLLSSASENRRLWLSKHQLCWQLHLWRWCCRKCQARGKEAVENGEVCSGTTCGCNLYA